MNPSDKSRFEVKLETLLKGFQSSLPASVTSVPVAGTNYTPAQISQSLQDALSLMANTRQAQMSARQLVQQRNAQRPGWKTFYSNLRTVLLQMFGNDASLLTAFGLSHAKKRTAASSQDKAIAAAKRQATRDLRNVMGSRQRQKVVVGGQPSLVVLTPDGKPMSSSLSTPASTASTPEPSATPAPGSTPTVPITPAGPKPTNLP